MKAKKIEIDPELQKKILRIALEHYHLTGKIKLEDLNKSSVEIALLLDEALKKDRRTHINITHDHRETILEEAGRYLKLKQYSYAKLFYALFFEHSLNFMVLYVCEEKLKLDRKISREVVRNTDIHAKVTWLRSLLGLKPFSQVHITTIKLNADERNAFSHYKWVPKQMEWSIKMPKKDPEPEDKQFPAIKRAVKYVKQLESAMVYKGAKGKIDRVFT